MAVTSHVIRYTILTRFIKLHQGMAMCNDLLTEEIAHLLHCLPLGLWKEKIDDDCRHNVAGKPNHVHLPLDVLETNLSWCCEGDGPEEICKPGQSNPLRADSCWPNLSDVGEGRGIDEQIKAGDEEEEEADCGGIASLVTGS